MSIIIKLFEIDSGKNTYSIAVLTSWPHVMCSQMCVLRWKKYHFPFFGNLSRKITTDLHCARHRCPIIGPVKASSVQLAPARRLLPALPSFLHAPTAVNSFCLTYFSWRHSLVSSLVTLDFLMVTFWMVRKLQIRRMHAATCVSDGREGSQGTEALATCVARSWRKRPATVF